LSGLNINIGDSVKCRLTQTYVCNIIQIDHAVIE